MPTETAITIRQPATANLMIDSKDRVFSNNPNPFDFQITKTNSIMNGFFSRIGASEVVLEWCENNISQARGNDEINIDVSGSSWTAQLTGVVGDSMYTVEELMNTLVETLNFLLVGAGHGNDAEFSVLNTSQGYLIDCSGAMWEYTTAQPNPVGLLLDLSDPFVLTHQKRPLCPDLRPYRYIDFTSSQLTYNQDLKDNSTALYNRDVLCRWYFSYDEAPILDGYGFPILMGYTRFCLRRLYNPPKQIKWSNQQPLGNLAFSVYDDQGDIIVPDFPVDTNWMMTLQLSEN